MSKYIDAEKLAKAIEDKGLNCSFALKMERLDTLALIDELQQEPTGPSNRKVLLCDLDGTLIVTKSGKTFPVDENDWQFKDGIKEAVQNYKPRYIFIVTNQGGIEKGFVDETKFSLKLKTIVENIRTWGDYIVDGIYCTSTDKNSWFRKPNVGMIDYFRNDWSQRYSFNNEDALMIGDMETDQECAKNAGISYLDVEEFIRLNKNGETNYTKRNALFDKCVANCDPKVMKEVSDNVDEMNERDELIESSRGYIEDFQAKAEADWGSFRRETAKDILAGFAAKIGHPMADYSAQSCRYAIELADELIKQLKEDKK